MIDLSVDIRDIKRVTGKLSKVARRFRNMRSPLKEAGLYMMREFTDRIDKGGPGWKPLSVITKLLRVKGKRRKFSSWGDVKSVDAKPLRDTGRLRQSIIAKRARGNVWQLTRRSLEVGTNVDYAKSAMGMAGPQTFNLPPRWYGRLKKNTTKKFRRESGVYPILKSMEGKRYKIPKRNPVFMSRDNRKRIQLIFRNFAAEMMRKEFGR